MLFFSKRKRSKLPAIELKRFYQGNTRRYHLKGYMPERIKSI